MRDMLLPKPSCTDSSPLMRDGKTSQTYVQEWVGGKESELVALPRDTQDGVSLQEKAPLF